jgi:predicted phosphodiesterase
MSDKMPEKYNVTRESLLEALHKTGSKRKAAKLLGMPKTTYQDYWNRMVDSDDEPDEHLMAVASDTHWGSKYSDVDSFDDFISQCKARQVPTLIHCGDLVEGLMPRESASHERFLHDVDAIMDYCIERFNTFADDFDRIYIVMGNHDDSLGRRAQGFDLCYNLAKQFKRVVYKKDLDNHIDVYSLKGGLRTVLLHGYGNCSSNLTSRTRGMTARLMSAKVEFDVLFAGHCHSRSVDYYLGKNAYSCGAFQKLTPYLATKPLTPMLEGYIFKYTTLPDGSLEKIIQEVINYD